MRKTLLTSAMLVALLCLSVPAKASPPLPLPNPDRPAVTPVAGGQATASANPVCPLLRRAVRTGNGRSSLMVKNLGNGKRVCSLNPKAQRSLASNTKIFTTVTALGRLGPDNRMVTKVFSVGTVRDGVLKGSLYLRGDGDPSLGTPGFLDAYLDGAGSDIDRLASAVRSSGIRRVTGRVYGDDAVFDRLRGVADSGYRDQSLYRAAVRPVGQRRLHECEPEPLQLESGEAGGEIAGPQPSQQGRQRPRRDRPAQDPAGRRATPEGTTAFARHDLDVAGHERELEQLLRRDAAQAHRGRDS